MSNTANVLGLQKEKVLSNLPKLFLMGENKIITEIMRNGGLGAVPVSKRSLRIPLQIASGGLGRLVNFDGCAGSRFFDQHGPRVRLDQGLCVGARIHD